MRKMTHAKITMSAPVEDYILCDYCGDILDINFSLDDRYAKAEKLSPESDLTRTEPYYRVKASSDRPGETRKESTRTTWCCQECLGHVLDTFARMPRVDKHLTVKYYEGTPMPGYDAVQLIPEIMKQNKTLKPCECVYPEVIS